MRSRIAALRDLISFERDISALKAELSQYPWDADQPFIVITKVQFEKILQKCINNVITCQDLEDWANTIECRDDLDFEYGWMQEIIFELSSPEIHGAITKERLQKIVRRLRLK